VADTLYSQVELHNAYGGVVPELASRAHTERIIPLIRETLAKGQKTLSQVDAIAYTAGPGLAGALLVGAAVAESLALALKIPVMPVHHLEGHLLSPLLGETPPSFPFVALLVSGGHSQFMAVRRAGNYELLGETLDDAAGEAFDKTAKMLGLPYPGGPALSRLAAGGNPERFKLPRPMLHSHDLNLSFSGLKTAVSLLVRQESPEAYPDIAASFEAAVVDVLVEKSLQALKATGMNRLVVAGGVGANSRLRESLTRRMAARGAEVFFPPLRLCTDNGAMIACAGAMRFARYSAPAQNTFVVRPRWPLVDYLAEEA
jgi:N6-L-threonylcarbamoyladenine synthase